MRDWKYTRSVERGNKEKGVVNEKRGEKGRESGTKRGKR